MTGEAATWKVVDAVSRPAGWYLLDIGPGWAPLVREVGIGSGAEVERSPVLPGRDRQVVLLRRPLRGLRVLVGDAEGPSRCDVRLSPLRRFAALRHMLADGSGIARATARTIAFARAALDYGVRVATSDLYRRYRDPAGAERAASPAEWRLRQRRWPLPASRLLLYPLHQLAADGDGGWRCTGGDPYFVAAREGGGSTLAAGGWYRMRGWMRADRAMHLSPSLYVRTAGMQRSFPDQVQIPEPGPDGRLDVLLRFDGDVTELRFDPAVRPLRFRMDGISLRRLPRWEWMFQLLLDLRFASGKRDWQLVGDTVLAMGSAARRGGLAAAGALLAARHAESVRLRSRSYDDWVLRYDTFSRAEIGELQARGQVLAGEGPLVSLLVPVYETPERWLRRCIESVLAQAYPRWELCIADDASVQPHVRAVLQEYARRDPRIRVAWREENGHIARASNTALDMARGDYVALLDHDDELRPHALLEVVEELVAHPEARFVYSDEDKIDAHGRRFHPYFKPDWNPDLLLSQNYLCHFAVVETALARAAGGFREGMEGSQDHDLFLRCTAALPAAAIRHVPRILYHWRAVEGSTALERGAKDYASAAGSRAVADHLRLHCPGARVEDLAHGHYRVLWPLPSPQPKVSIIVPTRDRVELLRQCVESVLERTDYANLELVVIDNGSRDREALAYLASLRDRERVRVLSHDAPFNFSEINNFAVSQCDGELLCLLNNDIEAIDGDWLREMASQALRPGIGAVGAMLLYPDDTIQHAGVILGMGGVANHAYCHQPCGVAGHGARALVAQDLSAVTAACLVVRRQAYLEAGGLDEGLQVAFNDIDFCLRLRELGYRNLWTPFARLYHHESASRGAEDTPEKVARFHREVSLMRERWAPVLDDDPAYNPNLSLEMEDTASELAYPPRARRRHPDGPAQGDRATSTSLAAIRAAIEAGAALRRPAGRAGGADVVLFWKQNDSTLYGRRNDMVARYLADRADVRRVIVVDAPISQERLAGLADGDGIDQARWIHDRTLEKLRGERDSGAILHRVFAYEGERYGTTAHEEAEPAFVEAYGAWLAREFERAEVRPDSAVFWIYPRDFCMPALLKRFRPARTVVDMVDDDRSWPGIGEERRQRLGHNYEELLRAADLGLANCATVQAGLQRYREDVRLVPNGVDEAHGRIRDPGTPPESGAVIGYVGNLESKMDMALLESIARRFPQHRLVLVGSTHANPAVRGLLRHSNVEMPGVVPYERLGDWLSCFDVAVIPHLDTEMTRRMNPLKMHVYLAWGIPVLSTAVANVEADGELVRIAAGHGAFLDQLEAALSRPRPPAGRFRAHIEANSWRARLDGVVDALHFGGIA